MLTDSSRQLSDLHSLLCFLRDVKEEEETTPWAEQKSWETEQIKKASMRVGSKDKVKKDYDLVFEDQIDFIMDKVEVGDIEASVSPDPNQSN